MSLRRSAAYFIGEQLFEVGTFTNFGIAVVRVAIGVGASFQRFGQRANVGRRIQLHRSEIDAVQHVQLFRSSLGPWLQKPGL